jgi:hypothetical protein
VLWRAFLELKPGEHTPSTPLSLKALLLSSCEILLSRLSSLTFCGSENIAVNLGTHFKYDKENFLAILYTILKQKIFQSLPLHPRVA